MHNTHFVTFVQIIAITELHVLGNQLPLTYEIFQFCEERGYPAKLTEPEKRNFRRKSKENFKVDGGQLYCKKCSSGAQSASERNWKLCIKTTEKKERVTSFYSFLMLLAYNYHLSVKETLHQDHRRERKSIEVVPLLFTVC